MYTNLFIIGGFFIFLNSSTLLGMEFIQYEEADMSGKGKTHTASKDMPVESDLDKANRLYYSAEEFDWENAFNIYVLYYKKDPDIAAFLSALGNTLSFLEQEKREEAKQEFLNIKRKQTK